MEIIGTVRYQEVSGGFWGIVGDDGQNWKPENLATELQKEGLRLRLQAKKSKSSISIFMWGTNIKITEYTILSE